MVQPQLSPFGPRTQPPISYSSIDTPALTTNNHNPTSIISSPLVNENPTRAFILPVTPEEISVSMPQGLRQDEIVNVGSITSFDIVKPTTIMFNSFFPEFNDTYVNSGFTANVYEKNVTAIRSDSLEFSAPNVWVERIRSFFKKPLMVIVTGLNIIGNYLIESFNISQIGGTGGEIQYSMSLKQYANTKLRNINIFSVEATATRNNFTTEDDGQWFTYFVKRHDSAIKISQKTGISIAKLIEYNGASAIHNLEVGQKLILTLRSYGKDIGYPYHG